MKVYSYLGFRVGDKLLCKKTLKDIRWQGYGYDKNKYYEILSISIFDSTLGVYGMQIQVKLDPIVYFWLFNYEIENYFFSTQELRKQKLKKIEYE